MISIVTSTIIPEAYSYFSIEDRYIQTIHTINTLQNKDFKKIYLLDNSVANLDCERIKRETSDYLEIISNTQYSFENKGLNEALLILNSLSKLPESEPVFKISGRYYPTKEFDIDKLIQQIGDKEILGICANLEQKIPFFSTRSYVCKDKKVLEEMLLLVIDEMIAYGRDINGIRGLIKHIKSFFKPNIGTPFKLSLEQSFARIIKYKKNYALAKAMNIEGFVAGSDYLDFISE